MTILPQYNITKKRLKWIPDSLRKAVAGEIKALLHSHRDCLRNRGMDTVRIPVDVRDGYYGEAFGIIRCLFIQGYGYLGSSNLSAKQEAAHAYNVTNVTQDIQNLRWWFSQMEKEVLAEENWGPYGDGSHRCEYCLKRYKKDDASVLVAQETFQKLGEP